MAPHHRTRRSRAQSVFSAFFHGHSVITPSSTHSRKVVSNPPIRTPIFDRYQTSALRSRSPRSTRSLIDPSSSPLSCAESLPSEAFPGFEGAVGRLDMAFVPPSRLPADDQDPARAADFTRDRRARRRPKEAEKEARRLCFPGVRNPRIRRKVIGCLISGSTLVIILTIYLALATSTHSTQAIHIVLILLTLIVTIIFCHYLIRLCMLAMPSKKGHARVARVPSRADGDGYAQPGTPIPIILARDEELGFVGGESEEEHEATMPTPPPPAYGFWRCSVRADPNLIHWQPTGLQEETRALVHAGLPDVRPPSYVSEGRESEGEEEVVEVEILYRCSTAPNRR